jgi:anaerobic selenocysteine-containing dehydrogenase
MTQLGAALLGDLEPPIEGLFVYNCNPAVTVPDQTAVLNGLRREDLFTVVFEQVMTDTAAFADIVLPATTFLEHRDVRIGYGSYVVGGVRPVVSPVGEARSNPDVFAALGRAMGFSDEAFRWDAETAFRKAVGRLSLSGRAADAELLAAGRVQRHDFPGETPVQFETVHPRTPDGKVQLTPATLGASPYGYKTLASDYPLTLISPATSKLISSTLGEFNFDTLWALIHPADAASRGIADGARVRVFNELGDVLCDARVRDTIRPGVVCIPKGAWRKSSGNGMTATALCPAHVGDVAGGACFNDARVEVEAVER